MKKSSINLGSTEQRDTVIQIIEDNLVTLLGTYNAHDVYSGLRYIKFKITTDISIIIKMLNPFPNEGVSYVLYLYITSNSSSRLIFSTCIQNKLGKTSNELLEFSINNISEIIFDTIEIYKTKDVTIIHNLDEEIPKTKSYTSIKLSETDYEKNIDTIVFNIMNKLDKYINRAVIDFKCTMPNAKFHYSITVEYSDIDSIPVYYLYINKRIPGLNIRKFCIDGNEFQENLLDILHQLYRVYNIACLEGDTRSIKFYMVNSESMDI